MHLLYYCTSLATFLAVASGIRLEKFTQATDYDRYFDILLGLTSSAFRRDLPCPPLDLDIRERAANGSEPLACFSSPICFVGYLLSAKRTSSVIYSLQPGKLTLETNISFENLTLSYPSSTISIFNQNFMFNSLIAVEKNEMKLGLTLSSKEDGSCNVSLDEANFTSIGGVHVKTEPIGFYNEMSLEGSVNNLFKNLLKKFNAGDKEHIRERLEEVMCSVTAS